MYTHQTHAHLCVLVCVHVHTTDSLVDARARRLPSGGVDDMYPPPHMTYDMYPPPHMALWRCSLLCTHTSGGVLSYVHIHTLSFSLSLTHTTDSLVDARAWLHPSGGVLMAGGVVNGVV